MRLVTTIEREKHKKIDGYIRKINIALIITLIIICIIIVLGWIIW